MFTSRLGILERLISISRHILGLRIINGLLRDVGAMEPWLIVSPLLFVAGDILGI